MTTGCGKEGEKSLPKGNRMKSIQGGTRGGGEVNPEESMLGLNSECAHGEEAVEGSEPLELQRSGVGNHNAESGTDAISRSQSMWDTESKELHRMLS